MKGAFCAPFFINTLIIASLSCTFDKFKPIPLSQLRDQWKPREWIVDLFGARDSCVLLVAYKGSGKTIFIYRMAEVLKYQNLYIGELKT